MEKVKNQISYKESNSRHMEESQKRTYQKNLIWNMIFSILNAGQSMLLLMIVNRLMGEDTAGLFALAFSVAVLMMNIGNYGIRNYQVSDVEEKHSFGEYCGFRFVTCVAMLIGSIGYVWYQNYDMQKAVLVLLLVGMRAVECVEDVFHGRYQQKQRLDIACKQGTIRIVLSIVVFFSVLYWGQDIVIGVLCYTTTNLICFIVQTLFTIPKFGGMAFTLNRKSAKELLLDCFPLFCGYFFSTYLGNVSKYAIDQYGTYQMQAHFNMIFMPVLVINLLSTMIFRPIIVDMATLWNQGKRQAFFRLVRRQLGMIVILAIIVIPLGITIGLHVLSILYGTSLQTYRYAFFILLLGGTFSAVSSFLNVCIITIREQRKLLLVIAGISIIAMITGGMFVKYMGMSGASYLYLILTVLQAAGYLLIIGYKSIK